MDKTMLYESFAEDRAKGRHPRKNNLSLSGIKFAAGRGAARLWTTRFAILFALLIFSPLFGGTPYSAHEQQPRTESDETVRETPPIKVPDNVLILDSYHATYPWSRKITDTLIRTLEQEKYPPEIVVFCLNGIREPDPREQDRKFRESVLPQIEQNSYRMIVAIDDIAMELLKRYASKIPETTPIVFAGYNQYEKNDRVLLPNMTGIRQTFDLAGTIDFGLGLFPDTKEILVVSDSSLLDQVNPAYLESRFAKFKDLKIRLLSEKDDTTETILRRVERLPKDSFVVIMPWLKLDGSEYNSTYAFALDLIRVSPGPCFATSPFLTEYTVGGYQTTADTHAEETAKLARTVYRKRSAHGIPPKMGTMDLVANAHALTHWEIPDNALPRGTRIVNKQPELLRKYYNELVQILILLIVLCLALLSFGVYFWFFRRAMHRYRAILEALPVRITVFNRKNQVLFDRSPGFSPLRERLIKTLKDVPDLDPGELKTTVTSVFHDGKQRSRNFLGTSSCRTAEFHRLPEDIFGEDAVLCSSYDNTELIRAHQLYKNLAEQQRITMQSLADGVIATDCDGRITFVNSAACLLLALREEELRGTYLDSIFRSRRPDGTPDEPSVRKVIESDRAITSQNDLILHAHDGHKHHIALTLAPIKDQKSMITGTVLVFRDTTTDFQSSKTLRNHIENERVINQCLARLVLGNNFYSNLSEVLTIFANHIHCDRAFFGLYGTRESSFHIATEWHAPELKSLRTIQNDRYREQFLAWLPRFANRELVLLENVPASEFADAFRTSEEKAIILAPVFSNEKLLGVLGLSFLDGIHSFSLNDENTILSAAKIIALAKEHENQRRAHHAALEEKNMILDNVRIPILLFDQAGKLIRVNPAAVDLCNASEDKILNSPCHAMFCHLENYWDCPVQRCMRTGLPSASELRMFDRDFIVTAESVRNKQNDLLYYIETAVDVTEINESKHKLKAAMISAQAAEQAKSNFLASMSHELRTPLNAVIGFSELLLHKENDASPDALNRNNEYLASIHHAGTTLLELINDVLDFSKIEAGQMQIVPQMIRLYPLLREVYSMFAIRTAKKGLDFSLTEPRGLPDVWLDPLRIRQVLFNLVGNAIKFTESGSICLDVHFQRTHTATGTLTFTIRDTGMGISPEQQKNIFSPFVQEWRNQEKNTREGTGLGLSIARRMTDAMGGTITLNSTLNKGTTFVITFPQIPYQDTHPVEAPKTARNDRPVPARKEPPSPLRNIRALAVDDVRLNRNVIEAMLQKLGVDCRIAESSDSALQIVDEFQPNLILTDMWMPEINGAELARKIREAHPDRVYKIIAVTADVEVQNNFLLDGIDGVMLKPVTIQKLRDLLHSFANEIQES